MCNCLIKLNSKNLLNIQRFSIYSNTKIIKYLVWVKCKYNGGELSKRRRTGKIKAVVNMLVIQETVWTMILYKING